MENDTDFIINQGANWNLIAFVQNPQYIPTITNPFASPVNLRGCSALLTATIAPGAPSNILELSSADGSLVINNDAGSIAWNIPAVTTAGFVATSTLPYQSPDGSIVYLMGYYTLKVSDPSGAVMRQLSGKLFLNLDP
jgi:hypothetical protein